MLVTCSKALGQHLALSPVHARSPSPQPFPPLLQLAASFHVGKPIIHIAAAKKKGQFPAQSRYGSFLAHPRDIWVRRARGDQADGDTGKGSATPLGPRQLSWPSPKPSSPLTPLAGTLEGQPPPLPSLLKDGRLSPAPQRS